MATVEIQYPNRHGEDVTVTLYTPTPEMLDTMMRKADEVYDEIKLLVTLAPLAPSLEIFTGLVGSFLTKEQLLSIAGIMVQAGLADAQAQGAAGVASNFFVATGSDGSEEGEQLMNNVVEEWRRQTGNTDE